MGKDGMKQRLTRQIRDMELNGTERNGERTLTETIEHLRKKKRDRKRKQKRNKRLNYIQDKDRDGEEVLLTRNGIHIRRKDMLTLTEEKWLNDEVVNNYLGLLKERSEQREVQYHR